MGNAGSAPEEVEGDHTCPVISYQALPESPATVKNGSAVFAQDHSPAMNGGVAVKESGARDNAAASSPKTKELSAAVVGREAAGSAASRALPSAKLRSVFAFSWSVPGRTEDPALDSSVGLAKLDVSSEAHGVNKAPSDSAASPAAAAPQHSTHKEPDQALPAAAPQLSSPTVPGTPEGEDAVVLKPKQVNFFDKIFKLEKGKERSQVQPGAQEGGQPLGAPDGHSTAQEAAGPQSASHSIPTEKEIDDCNQRDLRQDSAGVSGLPAGQPEKAEVKQDNTQAAAAVDNNPVMSFLKTLVSPSKAEARSEPEDKAVKETQQTTNTKNASEEAEFAHSEKADASLEAVTPDKDERSPEVLEVKPRREESKTPKANLRKFFKLSGRGSGGPTPLAEEIVPSPGHQTLNSTERPVATAESEPVGQKSKESSKDKKPPAELSKQKGSKQETREQPDCREQHAAETDSIQSGGDAAKDPTSFKRMEKRQSFGGFFKGLGSKRMSDAEVQTDPVSILPAGKSK
ncbi:breast carcinoma-amplified sequence 1 isoform X6 [Phasianus colchicus]|uniref:breast carcinoma-amplified sequence 1 isoform X6 n=1 Tax=Phasianus colchicus TaxID=9054 RepID=UPI00129EBB68|nr:breast carcinoma-amplified sequence 1 isoform X6 [Phasianus colchicus]